MNDTVAPLATPLKLPPPPFSLRTSTGLRKYLNAEERRRFRVAAMQQSQAARALCLLFYYTGCRVSEALGLTYNRIELSDNIVVLETLKQRRRGIFRGIRMHPILRQSLRQVEPQPDTGLLWPYVRSTGYRIVKRTMIQAGIEGVQACPLGLRHSFGVACARANVPVSLIKRWLGHSRLETTMVYLEIMGEEEHTFIQRLWDEEIY